MVSTFTPNKDLELPAHGDYVDTWEIPVNANMSDIDDAFGGSALLNATGLSGDQVLAVADYRPLSLLVSGAPVAATTYVVPSGVGGQWVFRNGTTGGFDIGLKSAAGGSTITVAAGTTALLSCDGSSSGMRSSTTATTAAAGSNAQVQYNSGGVLAGTSGLTWNGSSVGMAALNCVGDAAFGATAGNTITINGTTVTIPNNLNFGGDALYINAAGNQVGIGTTAVGTNALTVAGLIQATVGGYKFPDGTTQVTAAAGAGAAGSNTQVQFNNAGAFGASASFTWSGSVLTVPSLVLATTPLAVTSGGTGGTTATGTGAVVRAVSPALTGTPTTPTAAPGTNTTQQASTAFVTAAVAAALDRQLQKQTYTSGSNTFTPTVSGTYKVTVTGPGGAGGAGGASGAGSGGHGGGAGGTAIAWVSLTGGVGYAAVVGAAGNNSTFNTTVIGRFGVAATTIPGIGGTASGGTLNITGGDGVCGSPDGGTFGPGGTGGSSFWGGGGRGAVASGNGVNGAAYGSGGGGNEASTGGGGGTGGAGIILIEWVAP